MTCFHKLTIKEKTELPEDHLTLTVLINKHGRETDALLVTLERISSFSLGDQDID